jgi:hypothetical protein
MNIYGDNGNVLVLKKRLEWRGIPTKVINCGVGDKLPADTSIIIGGGGQDAGQILVAEDLKEKSPVIKKMAEDRIPMLMICGMYQMFGHYFLTQEEKRISGIGILDIYTVAEKGRLIGNIISATEWGDIVGYENHSGRTYIQDKAASFGKTKVGQGNNGKDRTEGAVYKNVYGTYMHGPILAKSPYFTDHLINLALISSELKNHLIKLDDSIELLAAKVAKRRPR